MTRFERNSGMVLRIVLGVLFLVSGIAKLFGVPHMVAEFARVGFGQWLRYATGLAEVAGCVLLVRPRTAPAGAVVLIGVCMGAFYAQATVLHEDAVHPIVIAVLLGWTAWIYYKSSRTPSAAAI